MCLCDEAFVSRMQALASDRVVSDRVIPKAKRAGPKTLQDGMAELANRGEARRSWRHTAIHN